MLAFRQLAPVGLARLCEFAARFRALGLPPRWALERKYRRALDLSQLDLIRPAIRADLNLVVDVGANVGDWSVGLARLINARQIIAFEPVPALYHQLVTAAREFPQIRCVNSAVGATIGEVDIYVHREHSLSSVLMLGDEARRVHGAENDIATSVRVPLTTLDHELRDQPEVSLLKIDVQGYEPEVLKGATEVLQRTRTLLVEVTYASYYSGDVQFGVLHNLITRLSGLQLWGISAPHCAPSGKPMWADAVYSRSSDDGAKS